MTTESLISRGTNKDVDTHLRKTSLPMGFKTRTLEVITKGVSLDRKEEKSIDNAVESQNLQKRQIRSGRSQCRKENSEVDVHRELRSIASGRLRPYHAMLMGQLS